MKFFATILLASAAMAAPTSNLFRKASACMTSSQHVGDFVAEDFTFSYTVTDADGKKTYNAKAAFSLKNTALSYEAKCTGRSHSSTFFDGGLVYECNSGDDTADEATFSYNHSSGKLAITQTWHCLADGARFTAEGDATSGLTCTEVTDGNKKTVECTPKNIDVPITSISAVA